MSKNFERLRSPANNIYFVFGAQQSTYARNTYVFKKEKNGKIKEVKRESKSKKERFEKFYRINLIEIKISYGFRQIFQI